MDGICGEKKIAKDFSSGIAQEKLNLPWVGSMNPQTETMENQENPSSTL